MAKQESSSPVRPSPIVRFRSQDDVRVVERDDHHNMSHERLHPEDRASAQGAHPTSPISSASPLPTGSSSIMYRIGTISLLLAVALPLLHGTSLFGHASLPLQPVGGVPIDQARHYESITLERRDNSPVDVCSRWAQQSAVVNGTLYLYGGQAKANSTQTSGTWNNDFLSLDLTRSWQVSTPALTGLPQPSGPPAVSLGTLWNSHDSLWLYGGEFSSAPWQSPAPVSLWEYDILSRSWNDHRNPQTSSGANAPSNGDLVQRAAEGAGVSVPSIGRAFYFGGHQDPFTTLGWAQWIPRVYLQSLLEFTFPGFTNSQVNALSNNKEAGADGNYRNITQGGIQSQSGFTERADGLLIYVPGFGEQGILLALAGGTNESFTQMNSIDVYDIANSTFYRQQTTGPTPNIRVNPCAVLAAAPDGSSYNIYMFGGQNLIPAGNQTQYSDMWILTLPSFTWIEVNQDGQSVPYGRSGHTCNVWDGQMVVVGGYTGDEQQLSCEAPGIYVFDLSKLQWMNQFTALSPGTDSASSSGSGSSGSGTSGSGSSGSGTSGSGTAASNPSQASSAAGSQSSGFNSTGSSNPFNQQPAQIYNATSPGGIEGSYGYQVPGIVASVIGGGSTGGATVTAPAQTVTAGPLATGKPVTYTITGPNGAVVTETGTPSSSNGGGSGTSSGHSGPNIAAIVVGVIAGLLFLLTCYLAFCAYVYRKQLQLYKRHVEMAQRQARGEKVPAIAGLLATSESSAKNSEERRREQQVARPWVAESSTASNSGSGTVVGSGTVSAPASGAASRRTGGNGYSSVRRSSEGSVDEDLLVGREPTFVGVMLNPRRSLRVINRD